VKIFTCSQIREIDNYTIDKEPVSSIDLMERAAYSIFRCFVRNYNPSSPIFIFAGPGNNGGDGIALARMLLMIGYDVKLFMLKSSNPSKDNLTNTRRLLEQGFVSPKVIDHTGDFPQIPKNAIVVDSLFGTGLSKPLQGVAASLVDYLNSSGAHIVAIDIPSGFFAQDNPVPNTNTVVQANRTITLQFPKLSFLLADSERYVGQWSVVDIGLHPAAIEQIQTPYCLVEIEFIRKIIKSRAKFSHKGIYGHCLLAAGSYGMLGAAVLSAKACLKSGVGLLTVHIPKVGYPIIQGSVPEAIVSIDEDDCYISNPAIDTKYSTVAFGPGVGTDLKVAESLKSLLQKIEAPMVIDADGLNILAQNKTLLSKLPPNTILTPHVGEFKRLFGSSSSAHSRMLLAVEAAKRYNVIIVIKGAFSQVICPNGDIFFNSTGNSGMATAGSGDVLTGVIASLLAQGYNPKDAAILGVYLHGKAGDIAVNQIGEESLVATDIINNLGYAFKEIHC
jgi:ADP-dependent NAD(P)H-hydrate dehydratase / NAD(P)H-hydrate epimerase